MRCTGLKKCIPQKFSGRCRTLASSLMGIVEVLDASTVSGRTFVSVSAQYGFLHFRVFHHRFNNHVDAIKTAVFQGLAEWCLSLRPASDRRFCRVPAVYSSSFAASVMPEGQRFVADVFHHHRHALPGRLVSDTAAHNASAQDGSMLRRLDIFGQLFRFRFDVLVVQEDTNQRAGLIGMGQRDKAFIFPAPGASSRPRRAAASK